MKNKEELIEKIKTFYNAGYSYSEIAKKVGLNESTVRVIINDLK